jgi:hypothetical protein
VHRTSTQCTSRRWTGRVIFGRSLPLVGSRPVTLLAREVRSRPATSGQVHLDSSRAGLKRFSRPVNARVGGGMGDLAACALARTPSKTVRTSAFGPTFITPDFSREGRKTVAQLPAGPGVKIAQLEPRRRTGRGWDDSPDVGDAALA